MRFAFHLVLIVSYAQEVLNPGTIEGTSPINVTVSTDAQQPTTNSSQPDVITTTKPPLIQQNATTTTIAPNVTDIADEVLNTDVNSDEQEELETEYGDGNMYESEDANAESQPDSEKSDAVNTDAAEAENPELVTSDSSQVTENPVEPRPTADATRQDASYEEEQNLDPAFMENNMQLDESADQQSVPTDVNIEDLSASRSSSFAIFALCLSGFLAGIAFVRWRRQRRSETARYVSTHATFNNPVSFPDMSYNDDPL